MGKLKKVIAIEKAEEGLKCLIGIFERRYENSQDKQTLLSREIEAHELLFDEKKLPLKTDVFSGNRPIQYIPQYQELDIINIREAYFKYIVNDANINDAGNSYLYKGRIIKSEDGRFKRKPPKDGSYGLYKRLSPTASQYHYYSEALMRFNYLNYLKEFHGPAIDKNESAINKNKLTQDQVALMYYYNGMPITRENGEEIARDFDWTSRTSGEGLYHKYCYYIKRPHRISVYTKTKGINLFEDFKAIEKHIIAKGKQEYYDDMQTLEANLPSEDSI